MQKDAAQDPRACEGPRPTVYACEMPTVERPICEKHKVAKNCFFLSEWRVSRVCVNMSLLREIERVCPDPLAMTRKMAVEFNRASLREYWQT